MSEIWVAAGTYKPIRALDENEPRSVTLLVPPEVSMYGGFAGGETDIAQRDIPANPTILSGDMLSDDGPGFANTGDNAFNVVRWDDAVPGKTFDGFIVTGGAAWDGAKWLADPGAGLRAVGGTPRFDNCEFTADSGGGLYLRFLNGTVVTNCRFAGNRSKDAASLGTYQAKLAIHSSTFTNNHPYAADLIYSSAFLTSCNFENNSTGLLNSGSIVDADTCDFVGHTQPAFTANAQPGPTTLRRCTFRDNSADHGAAIDAPDGDHTIDSCRFVSNTSIYSGGAIYAGEFGVLTVVSSEFIRNRSIAGEGGALAASAEGAAVVGCLVSGNHAGISGGALFVPKTTNQAPPTITNCTITDNAADAFAGGVYCPDGNNEPLQLRNSVLWGNTDTISPTQDAQVAGVQAPGYCLSQGWDGSLGGPGNSGANPAFADRPGPDGLPGTADDDLRAAPGSPMIDAGDNAALPPDMTDLDGDGDTKEPLPLDLDGHPRRADDTPVKDSGNGQAPIVDIGAYERPPCAADITGDGILDLFDFLGFQNLFVAQNPRADLDGNGQFDLFDFLAFQNLFASGCP